MRRFFRFIYEMDAKAWRTLFVSFVLFGGVGVVFLFGAQVLGFDGEATVERWLGLAKIQVQTASGSSSAEMTIEGLKDFEGVRDFLYGRMRGARDRLHASASGEQAAMDSVQLLANTLSEIAAELRQIRRSLPSGSSQESEDA